MAKKPKILGAALAFRGSLSRLNKSRITRLIMHHMAHETWDIYDVHNYHKGGNGWSGVGYNWWISFDGKIYEGRGWNQGAHASGYNTTSLGIGYQGDFTKQKMPDAQLQAGIELNNWLMAELGLSKNAIVGHRDVGNTTCPGPNFRMTELKNGAVSGTSGSSSSGKSSGVQWVGTNDKGKELIITAASVNYYDTQRWTNPTGSRKRGFAWKIDNLYRVNGSLQYRVQDANGNLFYTTGRSDLVRVGRNYTGSSSSSKTSNLPNSVYRANRPYPSGSGVRAVQGALASVYYYPDKGAPNNGVDGYYGPKTADAVRRFQSMHGLAQDGVYGPKTRAALIKAMN